MGRYYFPSETSTPEGIIEPGGINEFFRREGRYIARKPWLVILGCIAIWLPFMVPLIDLRYPGKGPLPFLREMDKDLLYSPISAPALKDRVYVESIWGDDVLLTSVYLASRNPDELNILSKPHLLELMDLWEIITGMEIEYEGHMYRWDDVCMRSTPLLKDKLLPCKSYSVLDAWDLNRTKLENDPDVLTTLTEKTIDPTVEGSVLAATLTGNTNAFGSPIFRGLVLGSKGVKTGSKGMLTAAEVFRISLFKQTYKIEVQGKFHDPVENLWELALVDKVIHEWKGPLLKGYVGSYSQVDQLSEEAAAKDSTWVILSFGLVLLVSQLVLFRNCRAFCKTHLAFISAIAIIMAITTAYGCVNLLGVPYNTVVQTVPFLLVGLGMDDTFVIMGAYSMVPHSLPLEERIARTMQQAGSSILFTSVTDFVAFSVGTFAQIPAVQSFCLYASVGIMFDFLFQVTFFVAFVALDARREGKKKLATGRKEENEGRNRLPTISTVVVTPGVEVTIPVPAGTPAEYDCQPPVHYSKWFGKGQYDPEAPTLGRRVVGEMLPRAILNPVGRVIVLLVEATLLAFAIYGCTKVYMDFRYLEWFTPKDSWMHQSLAIENKYFQGEQLGFSIYTTEASDGADYFYHQDELAELSSTVVNSPYVNGDLIPVNSWYDNFILWSRAAKFGLVDVQGRAPNATIFNLWLKEFLSGQGELFLDAVRFSEDGSHVISSRFLAFTQPVGAMAEVLDHVQELREDIKLAAPALGAFPYGFAFPFLDSFSVITSETVMNVLIAATAVFVISLFILGNFLTTVWVVLMVALTDIFLFVTLTAGFMHYVDLQFNIVTSINIILAVGIAVDYSSHIAHAYLDETGSRHQRATRALYCMGSEVSYGAITTLVAVLGLGFASHYVFNVFFKMFCMVVAAGLWHGVVVLPVVLSIMGSSDSWSKLKPVHS